MTTILEIRQRMISFYAEYDNFVKMAGKFLLTLMAMFSINIVLGYSETLSMPVFAVLIGLIGALIPMSLTSLLLGAVIMIQLYSLSMEAAAVVLVLLTMIALLYLRFAPGEAWLMILFPVCSFLKIGGIVPIAAGLLCGPAAAVPVGAGVIVAYYLRFIHANASSFSAGEGSDVAAKLRLVLDGLVQNKELKIALLAFVLVTLVVYMLRRRAVENAWDMAIISGAILELLILFTGDMLMGAKISIVGTFLGTAVSFALAMLLRVFLFNLDFRSSEDIQFEDDDYYYYVKAVPKMEYHEPVRKVQKISTSRHQKSAGEMKRHEAEEYIPEQEYGGYYEESVPDDGIYMEDEAAYEAGMDDRG